MCSIRTHTSVNETAATCDQAQQQWCSDRQYEQGLLCCPDWLACRQQCCSMGSRNLLAVQLGLPFDRQFAILSPLFIFLSWTDDSISFFLPSFAFFAETPCNLASALCSWLLDLLASSPRRWHMAKAGTRVTRWAKRIAWPGTARDVAAFTKTALRTLVLVHTVKRTHVLKSAAAGIRIGSGSGSGTGRLAGKLCIRKRGRGVFVWLGQKYRLGLDIGSCYWIGLLSIFRSICSPGASATLQLQTICSLNLMLQRQSGSMSATFRKYIHDKLCFHSKLD